MFYIVGNGPSLSKRVLAELPDGQWLGMNSAYRYWELINKYPKYYACLDPVVILSHAEKIEELHDKGLIHEFFLHDEIKQVCPNLEHSKRVTFLSEFIADENKILGFSELGLYKQTTGALALRYCIEKENDEFCLLGIDCNYVEILSEAENTGNHGLAIKEKVAKNPNYFFSDYQEKGDKYQVPNPSIHSGNLHLQSFLSLKKDLVKFGVDLEISVGSYQSLLYKHGVFNLVNVYDKLNINKVDCIAIPITEREVDVVIENFSHWLNPKLYPSLVGNIVENVHVFLDCKERVDIIEKFERYLSGGRLGHIVKNFKLTFLGLPDSVNYYLKIDDGSKRSTKSGPNIFWLSVMKYCEVYENTLQIESDCLPIRGGWFDNINNIVSNWPRDFWIMGPQYHGPTRLDMAYILHINGNAVYATGNSQFQDFLDDVYVPLIKDVIDKNNHTLAYDTAFSYLLLSGNDKYIQNKNSSLIRNLDKFVFSDFILNLGGRIETENAANYDITRLRREYPGAVLGHGRLFNQQVPKYLRELESFFSGADSLQRSLFIGGAWLSAKAGSIKADGFDKISFSLSEEEERFIIAIHVFDIEENIEHTSFKFKLTDCSFNIDRAFLRIGQSHDSYREYSVMCSTQDMGATILDVEVVEMCTVGRGTLVLEVKNDNKTKQGHFYLDATQYLSSERILDVKVENSGAADKVIKDWESFILSPISSDNSEFTLSDYLLDGFALVDYDLNLNASLRSAYFKLISLETRTAQTSKATLVIKGSPPADAKYIRVESKGSSSELKLRICRNGATKWEYIDLVLGGSDDLFLLNPFKKIHEGFRIELELKKPSNAEFKIYFLSDHDQRFDINDLVRYLVNGNTINAKIACEVSTDIFLQTCFSVISKSKTFSYLTPKLMAALKEAGRDNIIAKSVKHIVYIDPVYYKTASATQELRNSLLEDYDSSKLTLVSPSLDKDSDWELFSNGVSSYINNRDLIVKLKMLDAELLVRTAYSPLFDKAFYEAISTSGLRYSYFHMDLWDRRLTSSLSVEEVREFSLVFQKFLQSAKGGFAISERMKGYIRDYYDVDPPVVVHNFPSDIENETQRRSKSQKRTTIKISYIGGLEEDMTKKGVADFLSALSIIKGFPLHLEVFVKTFSRHKDALNNLLESHSGSWFTLTGSCGDLRHTEYKALLAESDVLLLTYNNNDSKAKDYVEYSFPNKFADYLSVQSPIIYYGPDFAVTDYIIELDSPFLRWVKDEDSVEEILLDMVSLVGKPYPKLLIDGINDKMGESVMKSNFYSKIY